MKWVVVMFVVLLVVLHQDFWWWDRADPFIFGFIPVGLMWHVGISLSAAAIAGLAVRYCWPAEVEELDTTPVERRH